MNTVFVWVHTLKIWTHIGMGCCCGWWVHEDCVDVDDVDGIVEDCVHFVDYYDHYKKMRHNFLN